MRTPTICLATLLGAVTATAQAAPAARTAEAGEYRFAVTPFIGYRLGGSFSASNDAGQEASQEASEDVSLEDTASFGLIINVPAERVAGDAYTEWEFYVSRQSAGLDQAPATVDPSLELEITHFLLGGTYVGEGELVRPFVAAGIGAAHFSPDTSGYDSDTVFAFGLGAGGQFFPARRVGLRLEGRVLGSVIDSDSAVFCTSGSAGATCAFHTNGDVLWQWEVFAGLTARF